MSINFKLPVLAGMLAICTCAKAQTDTGKVYHEPYRPQVHFSPKAHWTNDPNGMVYFNGIYHLFFQYYPNATVWGPMHWGHAESPDMIHWKEMPIALYPDSLGYIFSGSAVVDSNNTSGFGKHGKIPLVAIFTHHDPKGEKAGTNNFQNESIAYSLDNGQTWTKYSGNPVLKNPGIRDFRDPKVSWYEPEKKWVMTLATQDHITFFSSPNLKDWRKESEFGKQQGAHGGVWECPDLFPMKLDGKVHWILIVNINPGGPNGGSATQYFVGQFDGNEFKAYDEKIRWVDYGPDEYAGITWSNTGNRHIFLGWMSNWQYANQVPTVKWRNAMTIPRKLKLEKINDEILLASEPVRELYNDAQKPAHINIGKVLNPPKQRFVRLHSEQAYTSSSTIDLPEQFVLRLSIADLQSYGLRFTNAKGEKIDIGYDKGWNSYFIDRAKSGKTDFNNQFAKMAHAPRFATSKASDITLVMDGSSIELFADNGLTVMTSVFFPQIPFDHLEIERGSGLVISNITVTPLYSIWK